MDPDDAQPVRDWLIDCYLPLDRAQRGVLILRPVGSTEAPSLVCECLGKADNQRAAQAANPQRSPIRPYGDTPAGIYAPARITPYQGRNPGIGPYWLPMEGIEGAAKVAKEEGRTGLALHAGRGDLGLTPTFGCIRVYSRHFARIMGLTRGGRIQVRVFDVEGAVRT